MAGLNLDNGLFLTLTKCVKLSKHNHKKLIIIIIIIDIIYY